MSSDRLDDAIRSVERLRSALRSRRNRQVRNDEERSSIKATAYAWFKTLRPEQAGGVDIASDVDAYYSNLLEMAERNTTRARYLSLLQDLKSELVKLRTDLLHRGSGAEGTGAGQTPPDFSPLVANPLMRSILAERWEETRRCVEADACLAATVMMGGLLEGLLLARSHSVPDRTVLTRTDAAPKKKDGKSKPLQEWMLKDYLEVAHELGWITPSARDVGAVVRDYRNYIHPQKQLSHRVRVTPSDVRLFWSVFVEIARQLVDQPVVGGSP